jgi:threonine/homoserine/homoserine lactone efflux protein
VTATRGKELTPRAAFRQGLVSNLGNPKMAVFFTSLLPQFGHSFAALLVLGLVFCAMTLGWLCTYAYAVARAGDFLRRSRVRRTLDAVTGAVLVAFGLRLAVERP